MKKIIYILFVFLLSSIIEKVVAQDYHLSQYDAAPQYLNPALTGVYFNDEINFRINANYRAQWRSLSRKPYVTSCIGGDFSKKRFGYGAYIINNHAGSLGYYSLNVMLSGSYKIIQSSDDKHHLTVGIQMGLLQKGYNASYLFDSQYSPAAGGFDGSLPNNEAFNNVNILRYDAAMGAFYKNTDKALKVRPFLGYSVFHITMPNESFTSEKSRLPMRFVINGGAEYVYDAKLSVIPTVLWMRQDKANELNMGVNLFYQLGDTSKYCPMLGFSYRNKDAFIIQLGLKHGNNLYRISYDINTSSLKSYTGGRGAIEFSVIYTGRKKKHVVSVPQSL